MPLERVLLRLVEAVDLEDGTVTLIGATTENPYFAELSPGSAAA